MKPLFILLPVLFFISPIYAQQKVAIVNAKKVADSYSKKAQLVDEYNVSALERVKARDHLQASYITITKKMSELQKLMIDNSLAVDAKSEAEAALIEQSAKRDAVARDIASHGRRMETELAGQKAAMEEILDTDIKRAVSFVALERGVDLVLNSSYLSIYNPDSKDDSKIESKNATMVFIASRLEDLTEEVINRLNAGR